MSIFVSWGAYHINRNFWWTSESFLILLLWLILRNISYIRCKSSVNLSEAGLWNNTWLGKATEQRLQMAQSVQSAQNRNRAVTNRCAAQDFTMCSQTNDKGGTKECSSLLKGVAGWPESRKNNTYTNNKQWTVPQSSPVLHLMQNSSATKKKW